MATKLFVKHFYYAFKSFSKLPTFSGSIENFPPSIKSKFHFAAFCWSEIECALASWLKKSETCGGSTGCVTELRVPNIKVYLFNHSMKKVFNDCPLNST